ncbi:MAG: adenylate/guanylate cyclase domain-containing protein [Oligoflexia bacterium]|nr:adenylate/guanylate cyclase domain-containing protein [Oligoflexia bacterium]
MSDDENSEVKPPFDFPPIPTDLATPEVNEFTVEIPVEVQMEVAVETPVELPPDVPTIPTVHATVPAPATPPPIPVAAVAHVKQAMRIPIALKLSFITTLLMLCATIPIALRSSHLFEQESGKREEDTNRDQAKTVSDEVQETFQGVIDKSKVIGSILYKTFDSEANREAALELSFRSDRDLVTVEVLTLVDNKPVVIKRIINEEYLKQYDLKTNFIENLRNAKPFPIAVNFAGDVEIRNSTVEGGAPLLTIGIPLVKDDLGNITHVVLADVRLDKIQKIFSTVSERTIYLIDREGHVLAHPDEKLALTGKKLDYIPIVYQALTKKVGQFQSRFEDPETEETFVAAFVKTPFGATVVSQVPEAVILEPSQFVRRQAFLITGIVVSLALFFIVLFAASLTRPLEALVLATKEIAKGNFETCVSVSTKDEVGELATAFGDMVGGLKERDKVKNLFNKFHGTGVANQLMSGELKLGGEQKLATVFFSDIRGFTSFSENITPQEVVNMLNEYFKVMVSIINTHKGVVDKFIGDAIMAVWGAPESFGNDAANAIKACIQMRIALAELNDSRIARGLPEIKIGMGVHTGILIAGTIGSDDRMEYTVIGDTVNMASRIEAATKAYGTDLLVSEATCDSIKDQFVLELAGTAVVKGKTEPLKLFKVKGYLDEQGQYVEVTTKYSAYAAEAADKVKAA